MGVSFSEKPFSPVFKDEDVRTYLCGEINAELEKESIITAGRIISTRYNFTKKNEQFAVVIIEDISGQIEVLVWPRVFQQTAALWDEGKEVIVRGKSGYVMKLFNLACDSARILRTPCAR